MHIFKLKGDLSGIKNDLEVSTIEASRIQRDWLDEISEKKEVEQEKLLTEEEVQKAQEELEQVNKKLTQTDVELGDVKQEKEECLATAEYLSNLSVRLDVILSGIDSAYRNYIDYVHTNFTFEGNEIQNRYQNMQSKIDAHSIDYQVILSELQ